MAAVATLRRGSMAGRCARSAATVWGCPQCKTKYKRHKGSPPIRGEESEDVDADDASDFNYPTPGNQDHKHKIAERMLTWRMNSGASDDVGHAKYDSSEIGHPKYKAFAYFDRNQSGYIEIDELRESLAGGLGPNHEEVNNATSVM